MELEKRLLFSAERPNDEVLHLVDDNNGAELNFVKFGEAVLHGVSYLYGMEDTEFDASYGNGKATLPLLILEMSPSDDGVSYDVASTFTPAEEKEFLDEITHDLRCDIVTHKNTPRCRDEVVIQQSRPLAYCAACS